MNVSFASAYLTKKNFANPRVLPDLFNGTTECTQLIQYDSTPIVYIDMQLVYMLSCDSELQQFLESKSNFFIAFSQSKYEAGAM